MFHPFNFFLSFVGFSINYRNRLIEIWAVLYERFVTSSQQYKPKLKGRLEMKVMVAFSREAILRHFGLIQSSENDESLQIEQLQI